MSSTTQTSAGLEEFIDHLHDALSQHTKGHPEAFFELWSHAEDASIMAAVGGYHVGFDQVRELLTGVAKTLNFDTYTAQRLLAYGTDDMAFTVELELMTREADLQEMTLRTTQIYRRESGGWKLLHRHSEMLTPVVETPPTEATD